MSLIPRPILEHHQSRTRRQFFGSAGLGLGAAALATLLGEGRSGADEGSGGVPGLPHFAPKAKRVIYLMQGGAPSHVDLFDDKPGLARRRNEELPESVQKGQRLTTMTAGQKNRPVLPGIAGFRQYGQSGATLCDFLPHTASIADDLCFVKSMHTEAINHAPGDDLLPDRG